MMGLPECWVRASEFVCAFMENWLLRNAVLEPPKLWQAICIGALNDRTLSMFAENQSAAKMLRDLLDAAPTEHKEAGITLLMLQVCYDAAVTRIARRGPPS